MVHSPFNPQSSELFPEITFHCNIGPWLTFCEAPLSQSLITWKNKKKKYRLDGFLLMAEWSGDSFTFLPKPLWSDPHGIYAFLPSPMHSSHYLKLCAHPRIWISSPQLCLPSLIQDHPAKASFLQVSPTSHVKPTWLSQTGKHSSSGRSRVLCGPNHWSHHLLWGIVDVYVCPGLPDKVHGT